MDLPDDRHEQVLRRLLELSEHLTNRDHQGKGSLEGRLITLELRQEQLERDLRAGMQDVKASQQEILLQIKHLVDGTSDSLAVRTDRTQKSLERVHGRIDKQQQILLWLGLLIMGTIVTAIIKMVVIEPPTQVEIVPNGQPNQSK